MMKKSWIVAVLIISIPLFLMISCSKSSEDQQTTITNPGGGTTTCDTVGMKYSTDVVPILQSHCYSCHGTGNTGGSGGISLDGYSNIKGYAQGGTLAGVITHAPGFVAMPFGLPKLDACTINKILDWINQGAPNN